MKKRFYDFITRFIQKVQFGDTFTKVYLRNNPCQLASAHKGHAYSQSYGYVQVDRIYYCVGRQ